MSIRLANIKILFSTFLSFKQCIGMSDAHVVSIVVYSIRIKKLSFFRVPHLSRVPSVGLLLRRKLVGIGKVDSM